MTIEQKECREAFEKWAESNHLCTERAGVFYSSDSTLWAWEAWQHQNTRQPDVTKLVEVCRELTAPYTGNPDDPTLEEIIGEAKQALAEWEKK